MLKSIFIVLCATAALAQQPVNVKVNGSDPATVNAAGQNVASPSNEVLVGCQFNTTPSTISTGNMSPVQCDSAGNALVKTADPSNVSGTQTVGSLNAACTIALTGNLGGGFNLAAGTLVGTILPEISYDGGTTWVASNFFDPITNSVQSTIVFGASNTATARTIMAGNGVSNVRIRVNPYTSGTANCTARATNSDVQFVVASLIDGAKQTYRASAVGFTAAAGIIADLTGSATKTIRLTEVEVTCSTSGTAAFTDLTILKNSSADTSGTSATMTVTPLDSLYATGTATTKNYTAAPTAGSLVGTLYSYRFLNQGSTTVQPTTFVWHPGGTSGASAVLLRGVAQQIAVKLAAIVATETCDVAFEWTEE